MLPRRRIPAPRRRSGDARRPAPPRPSAPIPVETTGSPAAQASRIFSARTAAGEQRDHGRPALGQLGDRVLHSAEDFNSGSPVVNSCTAAGIFPDQPPDEPRPSLPEHRPNFPAEESHRRAVWVVLHIARKDDRLVVTARRQRRLWDRVGVHHVRASGAISWTQQRRRRRDEHLANRGSHSRSSFSAARAKVDAQMPSRRPRVR